MKFLVRAVLCAACVLGAAAPASACCLWPFGGWWGAGYSPGYGYGAAYPAYSAGYYSAGYYPSAGYYSAGYASSSACCATSCCDPCGGSSCGSSSCVGTTPSGTLKPAADDKFERKNYEDELERDREKLRDPDRDTDPLPRRDSRDDNFGAGRGMGDSNETAPFEEGIGNKPPMGDVDPDAAKDPDGFLPKEPQARRTNGTTVVAHTAGMLNGAGGSRRLASRSLPSASPKTTGFAGKSNDDKSSQPAPVRWISVPAPDGQVRL